jgi:hypothetical protein
MSWPNFEVDFLEKFSIILYTKPSIIKVEIYTKSTFFTNKISEFYLDIPGENVDSLTSTEVIQGDKYFKSGKLLNK